MSRNSIPVLGMLLLSVLCLMRAQSAIGISGAWNQVSRLQPPVMGIQEHVGPASEQDRNDLVLPFCGCKDARCRLRHEYAESVSDNTLNLDFRGDVA